MQMYKLSFVYRSLEGRSMAPIWGQIWRIWPTPPPFVALAANIPKCMGRSQRIWAHEPFRLGLMHKVVKTVT